MTNGIKERSITGFIWKILEKGGSQAISMLIQIVLARLLLPADYGIIGYLTVFINISDVFIQQGLTTALIQKKDADEIDYTSVFFSNICIALIIYLILWIISPAVSRFYHEPQLTSIMKVLSLSVIIGSFSAVHNAILAKSLDFKKSFYRGLANTVSYGIAGIIFAFLGFGVWSLVYGRLIGLIVGAITLWLTVDWKPKRVFSYDRVKHLFNFSSKVLGTNLLNTLFNNINSLIIGRLYTSTDLGYYQRGQNIPQTIMVSIDGSMTEVMYPTFSLMQSDLQQLKSAMRRSMKLSMYVVFPILVGLFVLAKPITVILLTEKWLPSVPFMQLTCVICMFWPLSARIHALNAIGKSNVTLKLSLIGKCISLVCLFIFARFGVIYIMYGMILTSCLNLFITSYYINKYLQYSLPELIKDICPAFLLALAMGIGVGIVGILECNEILLVTIQVFVGIVLYILGSILFKIETFEYVLNYVLNKFKS